MERPKPLQPVRRFECGCIDSCNCFWWVKYALAFITFVVATCAFAGTPAELQDDGIPASTSAATPAKGKLWVGVSATNWLGLAVGTNGYILSADSGEASGLKWIENTGGGSGTVESVATGNGLSGGPITTTGTIDLRLDATGTLSKTLGVGNNELGIASGGILNAHINNAAAIGWTKLSKTGSSIADFDTRSAGDLSSGTLPDGRFPATLPAASGVNLTALNASNLGSGTIPDARFPATLPALSGVNLTALNGSNIASGTVAIARGGTGAGSASAAFDALSPLTTAGDLLYYTTTNARLPKGTGLQLLRMNAGATAPEWFSLASTDLSDTANLARNTNNLSFFAATTSAQLAGVLSNETGTGLAVFNDTPTFIAPLLGTPTSGNLANCTFPTLNQNTTGSAATLTTPRAIYGNNFDGSAALTQIIASTYGGTANGFTKFSGPATTEKTFTLPNSSETLLYAGGPGGTPSSVTLTNGTGLPIGGLTGLGANVGTFLGTPSSANLLAALTDETGSGAAVFADTPTLVTPVLGVATATTINKVTITQPATNSVLTIDNGKTLRSTNTLTLSGTDTSIINFPSTGTVLYTFNTFADMGNSTSAQLRGNLTDETGTGLAYFQGGDIGTPSAGVLTNATGLVLTTGQTGILPSPNGGTANGFTKFSGPATTEKTFTLPNASATILTDNASVTTAQGGTNTSTAPAVGQILVASSTSAYTPRAISGTSAKTSGYTVVAADANKVIKCDASGGAFTITLDPAATLADGFLVTILKTSADTSTSTNAVTIDANASETIDGALTNRLQAQYSYVKLICDGSNWFVLSCSDWCSANGNGTSFAASGNYADGTSLEVPPGEWNLTVSMEGYAAGVTTFTYYRTGISTTSGNSGTGLSSGVNLFQNIGPPATGSSSISIAHRATHTTATTYYHKILGSFSGGSGTPSSYSTLIARRAR